MAKQLDPDENERLRDLLRQVILAEFGGSQAAAAQAMGITPTSVSDILRRKRGVGAKVQRGIAKFRPEAVSVVLGGPRGLEFAPRYTNRQRAIESLSILGTYSRQEVEAAADAFAVALDADQDPDARWWRDGIEGEVLRARRMKPHVGHREVTDDDDL